MDPAIPASRTMCYLGLRVSAYLFGSLTKGLNQKSRENEDLSDCTEAFLGWVSDHKCQMLIPLLHRSGA